MKVVKNKLAPPFGVAEFKILYNKGISRLDEVLDMGVEEKLIEKVGAWYALNGNKLGQGRDAASVFKRTSCCRKKRVEIKIKQARGLSVSEDELSKVRGALG